MRDISGELRSAALASRSDMVDESDAPARRAALALDGESHWEFGEEWASIVRDEKVLAHLHVRTTLAICLAPVFEPLRRALGPVVTLIPVSDMDSEELCASEESLLALFGRDFAEREDLVPEHFAASDLWFSTI